MTKNYSSLLLCLLFYLISVGVFAQNKVFVKAISIKGNKKTKEWVILRGLTFQVGDSLDMNQLNEKMTQSQQNIYNSGLFTVAKLSHTLEKNTLSLLIEVVERWYIYPKGGVALEERNAHDFFQKVKNNNGLRDVFHRSSANAHLSWRNITGNADGFWAGGSYGFTNSGYMGYFHPNIWKKQQIGGEANAYFWQRNEVIYGSINGKGKWGKNQGKPLQTSIGGSIYLYKRIDNYQGLSARISYDYYAFADTIGRMNATYTTNRRHKEMYPALVLSYGCDKRDVKAFPLNGFRFRTAFRAVGFAPFSSARFLKFGINWAQYLPLSKRLFLSYQFQNVISFGRKIPYFEKNSLWFSSGGLPDFAPEIRGYEGYIADASFFSVTKLEIKYALLPHRIIHLKYIPFKKFQDMPLGLYLSTFLDAGTILDNSYNNSDNYLKDRLLYGYGIAANIYTIYDKVYRFELSRNNLQQWSFNINLGIPIR
jgi:outer membrane protein assembly factor BamA